MPSSYFSPAVFRFLTGLALNNSRSYFGAHQAEYEQLIREPALRLIRDFAPKLRRISPHLTAVDKKVGGSLLRIQRDTRFSSDKSPYKTNLGIYFRHDVGKDIHAPGLYLHLAPDGCFLAAGVWHPDRPALDQIRQRILERPAEWKRASRGVPFTAAFILDGDSLSRPPRGIPVDHPLLEDLKRTDHVATAELSHKQAISPGLLDLMEKRFTASRAYMRFLCKALDLEF